MSYYRISKIPIGKEEAVEEKKFDNKEDAEHYAKNQSVTDDQHTYKVEKNQRGEFNTVKLYQKGIVV